MYLLSISTLPTYLVEATGVGEAGLRLGGDPSAMWTYLREGNSDEFFTPVVVNDLFTSSSVIYKAYSTDTLMTNPGILSLVTAKLRGTYFYTSRGDEGDLRASDIDGYIKGSS